MWMQNNCPGLVIATFPLAAKAVKVAALNAYQDVARGLLK